MEGLFGGDDYWILFCSIRFDVRNDNEIELLHNSSQPHKSTFHKLHIYSTHGNTTIISMSSSQFNRGLITLGPRITKEGFITTRILAQPRRQQGLLRRIIQIRNVMDLGHLSGYRGG